MEKTGCADNGKPMNPLRWRWHPGSTCSVSGSLF